MALPERREALFTEAFCKVCESATPIIISQNLLIVELICGVCDSDIRYIIPRVGLDYCVECGLRVRDGERNGFESPNGQRGHASCQQRVNARMSRAQAESLREDGWDAAAERHERLADEADAAANRMESEAISLTPIVVMQRDEQHWPTEQHVFPDGDALVAWLDSQDTTVYLEVQPRDEVL